MKVRVVKGTNKKGCSVTEITSNKGNKIIIDYGKCVNDGIQDATPDIDWSNTLGVFITHNHDDHIGFINDVPKDVPVYVEREALGVYKIIADFYEQGITRKVTLFAPGDIITLDDFKIVTYQVDHSAYNSCMFLVEVDGKRVLHMSDFREHGRQGYLVKKAIEDIKEVDVLCMEGATITRPNNDKKKEEDQLQYELYKIMRRYRQVFVVTSSSNIDRLITTYKASYRADHIFIEDPTIASIGDYLDKLGKVVPNPNPKNENDFRDVYTFIPKYLKEKEGTSYKKYINNFSDRDAHALMPFSKYVFLIKPEMFNEIKKLYIDKGYVKDACLIYSMWDGYLDRPEMRIFIENMKAAGIKVYYKHTSGHNDEEAREFVTTTLKYKYLKHIHTEDNDKYINYPELNLTDLEI